MEMHTSTKREYTGSNPVSRANSLHGTNFHVIFQAKGIIVPSWIL